MFVFFFIYAVLTSCTPSPTPAPTRPIFGGVDPNPTPPPPTTRPTLSPQIKAKSIFWAPGTECGASDADIACPHPTRRCATVDVARDLVLCDSTCRNPETTVCCGCSVTGKCTTCEGGTGVSGDRCQGDFEGGFECRDVLVPEIAGLPETTFYILLGGVGACLLIVCGLCLVCGANVGGYCCITKDPEVVAAKEAAEVQRAMQATAWQGGSTVQQAVQPQAGWGAVPQAGWGAVQMQPMQQQQMQQGGYYY
mmetsp:Transcript_6501/g.21062  ORF Transcript_6501/g.21062 Transcript_6501/m.21062 type:complete len:251 (-) Transcript_6501:48-800(-)